MTHSGSMFLKSILRSSNVYMEVWTHREHSAIRYYSRHVSLSVGFCKDSRRVTWQMSIWMTLELSSVCPSTSYGVWRTGKNGGILVQGMQNQKQRTPYLLTLIQAWIHWYELKMSNSLKSIQALSIKKWRLTILEIKSVLKMKNTVITPSFFPTFVDPTLPQLNSKKSRFTPYVST